MHNKILLTLSLFLVVASKNFAQLTKINGDPHGYEKFKTLAIKDPAYVKLMNQVNTLSTTATGRSTNAAAVKALFSKNKNLLTSIYKKAIVETPSSITAVGLSLSKNNNYAVAKNSISDKLKFVSVFKTETPPYDRSWIFDDSYDYGVSQDTSASVFTDGKAVLVFHSAAENLASCRLGDCFMGYWQSFAVPADPEIIAAEVKFEYSYLYTGWDTYGAVLGMKLIVHADNFAGPDYNGLVEHEGAFGLEPGWKDAAQLYPSAEITSEFAEFHSSFNSSFTLGGYVTPGSVFTMKLAFGFDNGTLRGMNGSYHYAEMVLKKITVKFLK